MKGVRGSIYIGGGSSAEAATWLVTERGSGWVVPQL